MFNKQQIKSFLAGVLITLMLFSVVFAAPVTKTIKAVFNNLNMQVNGKAVKADTIVYNNTLYAPVKTVAEALGKDFKWDAKTNAVTINDKPAVQNPPVTPLPQGSNTTIEFSNVLIKYNVGITNIYGEATNKTTKPQTFTLKVTFYDSADKIIGTTSGVVNEISPGETKTFAAVAISDYSNAASYKIQVDTMLQASGLKPNLITFSKAAVNSNFGLATVDVDAKNNDTKPHSFTATISFYDASKKLIGVAVGAINDIGAGETKTLSAMSMDDISKYATYKVEINTMLK